jgi:hypothetical protein
MCALLAREVTPLRRGASVTEVVTQAVAELGALVAQHAPAGSLPEALRGWVQAQPVRLPGTSTRPGDVADLFLRRATGRGLAALLVSRREARQEAAWDGPEDHSLAEGPNDGAAEAAPDVPDVPAAESPRRSPATTCRRRIAGDLLDDVLEGRRTALEAAEAYGVPTTGVGRPRRWATFADYVRGRLAEAENPENLAALRLALERRSERHAQAKSAETQRIARMMRETGAEWAGRLRGVLVDLG